jgi:NADPH:quinone reductase-like Zn-dependent oxidoreductase
LGGERKPCAWSVDSVLMISGVPGRSPRGADPLPPALDVAWSMAWTTTWVRRRYRKPEGPVVKAFIYQTYGPPETLRIAEVGSGVTRFKPGDEVYANLLEHGYGGFAEYASVPVDVLWLKPASLSFEEAAAVPMAAVTALQGLRVHGAIQPTQKVLINGATGGVGTLRSRSPRPTGPR